MAAIPWADISNNPSDYYDTNRFEVPIKLNAPEQLTLPQLWSLAEFLSSMENDAPLVFRDKVEISKRSDICQAAEDVEQMAGDEDLNETSDDEGLRLSQQHPTQDI